MTKEEFKQAVELARDRQGYLGFDDTNIHIFSGFCLKGFKPVHCTLADVADLIRWQAFKFNGEIDAQALDEIAEVGRHKFIVVG